MERAVSASLAPFCSVSSYETQVMVPVEGIDLSRLPRSFSKFRFDVASKFKVPAPMPAGDFGRTRAEIDRSVVLKGFRVFPMPTPADLAVSFDDPSLAVPPCDDPRYNRKKKKTC